MQDAEKTQDRTHGLRTIMRSVLSPRRCCGLSSWAVWLVLLLLPVTSVVCGGRRPRVSEVTGIYDVE